MITWIGYGKPNTWTFKQDIPKQWQHWAMQVYFPFAKAWIVRDENSRVYMDDGNWAETLDFYLNTPGHVIGLRDLEVAARYSWGNEWRQAMKDHILESLELRSRQ